MKFKSIALLFAFSTAASPWIVAPSRGESSGLDMHNYLKGHFVFDRMCAPCHGKRGRGDGEWSIDLVDKPRNFRMGIFKFRSTPCGSLPTNEDLERTIRGGVSGTAMPAFKDLPDADIKAVIVFLQNFSSRWDDPKLRGKPIPLPDRPPDWFYDLEENKAHITVGRELFERTCAACHGMPGKGDGPVAAGQKDVWGNAIAPANLTAAHHKSGDDPKDLYRTIATGLDGTPMMGYHAVLDAMSIWNLVAYIVSIAEPEKGK